MIVSALPGDIRTLSDSIGMLCKKGYCIHGDKMSVQASHDAGVDPSKIAEQVRRQSSWFAVS